MASPPKRTSRTKLRRLLWPELPREEMWSRTEAGWVALPRTLPLILAIMDDLSGSKHLGATYLELSCRDFGDHLVILSKPREMALHAGFKGKRAESAWLSRVGLLKDLGFIKLKDGPTGAYSYALIMNPHRAVKELAQKGKVKSDLLTALRQRAIEVGSDDPLMEIAEPGAELDIEKAV